MVQVNVYDAKTQLSSLIARVLDGEQVTIARAGVPLVDLVVHDRIQVVYGLGSGSLEHDPAVFDGVDDEISTMFYGEN
jgi:antitoxin (DNA-binding transcriptional repressor) of toxin-antitoxin stability system